MAPLDGFEMQSNVARDVLSTASSFGSLAKVIAEYVTNSIDARVNGTPVSVNIVKSRYGGATRIVISDDARGMDDGDLRRFFIMHAENEARRHGRSARGRFGTGKAAAFGVGTSLQVETRQNGRQWRVRLEKSELEAAVSEQRPPCPEVLLDGEVTTKPNGTDIIIEGITKTVDERRISGELRKRLGRQLDAHPVKLFNTHVVTVEPRAAREWPPFRSTGHAVSAVIGDEVECRIKAAATTVDDAIRGVIVTANDFPVAQIEVLGDYGVRIFGQCEVPALEVDDSTPGPYTDARDLTLNEDNFTAGPLAEWIRECLGIATAELAAEERERRLHARDEALRTAASKMESVLNRHYQGEFRRTRSRTGSIGMQGTDATEGEGGQWVVPNPEGTAGYESQSEETSNESAEHRDSDMVPEPPDELSAEQASGHPQEHEPFGEGRGDTATEPRERPRRRTAGGFTIEWDNGGRDAPRSNYIESELIILINLDHPEIAAAYSAGDRSPLFRMLVFEAALQEYSYATAYQQLNEDPSMDGSDALQYVRQTVDLLTREVAEVVVDLSGFPIATLFV
jgi:hypothetical protein